MSTLIGFKRVVFAAVAAMGFAANAAVVYLKPLGADETRETQDGASWATAYDDWAVALAAAAETEEKTLYVAQGLWNTTCAYTLPDGIKIYGSFPGVSDSETLESRDRKLYPTILRGGTTCTANSTWILATPDPDGYSWTTTDTKVRVVQDGKVVAPPAYPEGDRFSAYYPSYGNYTGENTFRAFTSSNGATVLIDGLVFTGYRSNSSEYSDGLIYFSGTKAVSETSYVRNCSFIGNLIGVGTIGPNANRPVVVEDCEFLHNTGWDWAVIIAGGSSGADCTMRNCVVEGVTKNSNSYGSMLFYTHSGTVNVTSTEISRCIELKPSGMSGVLYGGWGGGLIAASKTTLRLDGLYVHDCFMACADKWGDPFIGTGVPSVMNCTFVGNRCNVKPGNGYSYAMFGQSSQSDNTQYYGNCLFKDNVIAAPSVQSGCTDYSLSVVGGYAPSGAFVRRSVVGCSFDSNVVEENATVPATVKCRGALIYGYPTDNAPSAELGLANCTFKGPKVANVFDVAQVGNASKALNIVNTLFLSTDEVDIVDRPIYAVVPTLVKLWSCTFQNLMQAPEGYGSYEAHAFDVVPLAAVASPSAWTNSWTQPAACPPSLGSSADVALNGTSAYACQFKPFGSDAWQALTPTISAKGSTGELVADVFGTRPAAGEFRRGAVQGVTAAAASGKTLTVRFAPSYTAGHLKTGPLVQAVGEGGCTAIEAESSDPDRFTFEGWKKEDGTLFSESAKLEGETFDDGFFANGGVLVATFAAPKLDVTFDLGAHGRFVDTGLSTVTIPTDFGAAMPEVPPFEVDEGYLFCGWQGGALPQTVEEGATYLADILPTFRSAYVVPADEVPAGSDGSGSSWENATSDIAAAIAYAGRTSGEVWLKKGVYKPSAQITLKGGVSVYGGFAGNETSRTQADPKANVTVLSNGIGRCFYFYDPEHDLGQVTIGGLVFKGFTSGTVDVTAPRSSNVTLTNCVFEKTATVKLANLDAVVSGCSFTNNTMTSLQLDANVKWTTSLVERCEFRGNSALQVNAYEGGARWLWMRRCRFVGNSEKALNVRACDVIECEFARNTASQLVSYYSSDSEGNKRCLFDGCSFHDNVGTASLGSATSTGYIFGGQTMSIPFTVLNTSIYNNKLTVSGGSGGIGFVLGMYTWSSLFANCAIVDNEIVCKTDSDYRINLMRIDNTRPTGIFNCIIKGTKTSGDYADKFREFYLSDPSAAALVNTVVQSDRFDNSESSYANGNPVNVHSVTNAGSSVTFKRMRPTDEWKPMMWAVWGDTPLAKASCPVWVSTKTAPDHNTQGIYYYPEASGNKWFRQGTYNWDSLSSVSGYTLETPVLPDAWGNARNLDLGALGPMPAAKAGLAIMVQ